MNNPSQEPIDPAAVDSDKIDTEHKEYFPLFVTSKSKRVLVVGGGKIAQRRILTLLKFEFSVTVIATEIQEELFKIADVEKLELVKKAFDERDIDRGYDYILAATNNRQINSQIGKLAKEKDILVNVADCKEECDFFFPGVIIHEEAVIGVTCEGKSHSRAKDVAGKIRNLFKDTI